MFKFQKEKMNIVLYVEPEWIKALMNVMKPSNSALTTIALTQPAGPYTQGVLITITLSQYSLALSRTNHSANDSATFKLVKKEEKRTGKKIEILSIHVSYLFPEISEES